MAKIDNLIPLRGSSGNKHSGLENSTEYQSLYTYSIQKNQNFGKKMAHKFLHFYK